jgi:type I restriction enzyme S subunit
MKLSDLARIDVGYAFESNRFSDDPSNARLLRGANVGVVRPKWSDVRYWDVAKNPVDANLELKVGDIVVAMDACFTAQGELRASRLDFEDLPALLVQRVARLRARDSKSQGYLWSIVRSSGFAQAVHEQLTGSVITHISSSQLGDIEIDEVPAFAERYAIGSVLDALDDKTKSNHRLQSLLQKTVTTEYELITQNRDLVEYRSALDVVMGVAFSGDHFSRNGVGRPLIRIRDLKSFVPQTWTTETRADEVVIRAGDVVVGMDAEFRSTLWIGEDGLLNQRVCKFVPKPGVATAFAWCAIKPDLEYCERAKTGTTVIHLNRGDIERFSVPQLTVDEHQRFETVTEPMLRRLVAAGLENMQLVSLKEVLLPELLSGRLRVKDAESMMENV